MSLRAIVFAIAVTYGPVAFACGCYPGMLEFEDSFFRYCDDARAEHAAQTTASLRQESLEQEKRLVADRPQPAPKEAAVASIAP